MPPQPQRCWAEIDLAAFERNVKRIQNALPPGVRYIAVVKADAYGHGLPAMARHLMQSGVDCFAVANVSEAIEIRHMGVGWPILVLGPVLPGEEGALIDNDLLATVSGGEDAARLHEAAATRGTRLNIHLKIDTGMGRLGVWHGDAAVFATRLGRFSALRLDGVYTHFSSADSDPAFTETQRVRFTEALNGIRKAGWQGGESPLLVHADNSASLEAVGGSSPFDAVRVGLLQFGIPPYPDSALAEANVEPVFGFYARVGLVKSLPHGTDISYQRTCTLKRPSTVAVLTAGYGDGIPLGYSNRGSVLIRGQRCPVLGRVTMDQTIIDVTDLSAVSVGDCATLIGREAEEVITVQEFSDRAGSIPWEVLCSITKRVTRIYRGSRDL